MVKSYEFKGESVTRRNPSSSCFPFLIDQDLLLFWAGEDSSVVSSLMCAVLKAGKVNGTAGISNSCLLNHFTVVTTALSISSFTSLLHSLFCLSIHGSLCHKTSSTESTTVHVFQVKRDISNFILRLCFRC